MKYIILIGDGMGDYPLPELDGRTPLMAAKTPNLDFMAARGLLGRAATVPEGMPPGSDVAIMSLMGYDPRGVLSGRGPLEAASQGLSFDADTLVFRLNLVTLDYKDPSRVTLLNHASGNISTQEGHELVEALNREMPMPPQGQKIFGGVSYRHLLAWPGLTEELPSIPPHDYRDQQINVFLDDPKLATLMNLVKASWPVLENHPVNLKRRKEGLPEANSIWPWGQGKPPKVKSYQERWGLTGATVSAVDLIKGLGLCTGLEAINVPGATGWLDTNFEGKVAAALSVLEKHDFVLVHIEAPDESSHQGDLAAKMSAIENFDAKVVGPMLKALPAFGDFKILCACDHYTPLSIKTHSSDPVPFIIYSHPLAAGQAVTDNVYNEETAEKTGVMVNPGSNLGQMFFGPELADK